MTSEPVLELVDLMILRLEALLDELREKRNTQIEGRERGRRPKAG